MATTVWLLGEVEVDHHAEPNALVRSNRTGLALVCPQGYPAYTKPPPRRTLPYA